MSASEKLKALEQQMRRHQTEMLYPESSRLRDALPQIVAVVEAAEIADDAFENWRNAPDGELSDYAVEEVMAKLVNARISLAALDEALS